MSRYIDADALRKAMYNEAFETDTEMQKWDSGCWIRYKLFENILEQQPTADVVEVVRCKDCKYGHQYTNDKVHCSLGNDMYAYRPNDYCSYGERREDGE